MGSCVSDAWWTEGVLRSLLVYCENGAGFGKTWESGGRPVGIGIRS